MAEIRMDKIKIDKVRIDKKSVKSYIAGAVLTGAALFLFYLAASGWGGLSQAGQGVQMYLEEPVSTGQVLALAEKLQEQRESLSQENRGESRKEAIPEFCLWGQMTDRTLTNENLSRSTQSEILLLCGNPKLLFEGGSVAQEDMEGCLIDEQTAWELFGSRDAEGGVISCEGKEYTVRAVIQAQGKLMAVQAQAFFSEGQKEPLSEMMFWRVTMGKNEDSAEITAAWLAQNWGISGQILDLELLSGIGGSLVLLFPLTAGWFLCCGLWRERVQTGGSGKIRQEREAFLQKLVSRAGALLLLVLLFVLLSKWIQIPASYIPTSWSEVAFWSSLWQEKAQAVKLLVQIPKSETDFPWIQDFMQCMVCGGMAEGITVFGWVWARSRKI